MKSSTFYISASNESPFRSDGLIMENLDDQYDLDSHRGKQINCQISDKYPTRILRWCSLITQHAQKNKLPPDLVAAIIWQESGGNPHAYSVSGAVGLMQVMSRDGRAADFQCVNGPCFANRPTIEELKDPAYNIKYGSRMLASLVNKHGTLREALKAYGPMNVGYTYADKVMKIYTTYGK